MHTYDKGLKNYITFHSTSGGHFVLWITFTKNTRITRLRYQVHVVVRIYVHSVCNI